MAQREGPPHEEALEDFASSGKLSVMDRRDDRDTDPEMEGIPTDYDQLEGSEWGLDWGDISQIRAKLKLTPTERLQAAQDLMNTVIRIRTQNVHRA